ncbi:hypothetical protein AKJ41_03815 [candidate division MSBL1 archaeon SCGC-AAA259O05]|uniref:Uncharacterized protein n=1 Tax=candidate division MSBL1 archaeon SCGC-AAA259O05 TaxID=1698271 RepID=A0A133V2I8_9EURY|nr:hypothetical protein AKJ41_03815 [candidate division MSBL1 archaeon SCGC-AAA259O05]
MFEEGGGEEEYGTIAFPGFTFPNDFRELETFGHGGFYTVKGGKENLEVERIPLELAEVVSITVDAENRTPDEVERSSTTSDTDSFRTSTRWPTGKRTGITRCIETYPSTSEKTKASTTSETNSCSDPP